MKNMTWEHAFYECLAFYIKLLFVIMSYYASKIYIVIRRSKKKIHIAEKIYRYTVILGFVAFFCLITSTKSDEDSEDNYNTSPDYHYFKIAFITLGAASIAGAAKGFSLTDKEAYEIKKLDHGNY